MAKLKTLLILTMTSFFSQACHANSSEHIENSRLNLQNYGFAYCMTELVEDSKNEPYLDYSRAVGIYFNNGNHNSPEAYQAVENYIKLNIEPNNFKSFEGDNSLFTCLKVYNSIEYKNLVKQLDVYISPE